MSEKWRQRVIQMNLKKAVVRFLLCSIVSLGIIGGFMINRFSVMEAEWKAVETEYGYGDDGKNPEKGEQREKDGEKDKEKYTSEREGEDEDHRERKHRDDGYDDHAEKWFKTKIFSVGRMPKLRQDC